MPINPVSSNQIATADPAPASAVAGNTAPGTSAVSAPDAIAKSEAPDLLHRAAQGTWDFLAGDDIKTLRDPNASYLAKGLAGADLASWVLPGPKELELGGKALFKGATELFGHAATHAAEHVAVSTAEHAATHVAEHSATDAVERATTRGADRLATSSAEHSATAETRKITLSSLDDARKIKTVEPHATYEVAGKRFTTDGLGRPLANSGELRLGEGGLRNKPVDAAIGRSGKPADIGFHMGADRFGFPGGKLNIVPGDKFLNNGPYARFEDHLAGLVNGSADGVEHHVDATFRAVYNKENVTNRPDKFVVEYRVDGGDTRFKTFLNKKGG